MIIDRTVVLAFAVVMLCVAAKAMLSSEEDRVRLEQQYEEHKATLAEERAAIELERDRARRAIKKERQLAQQDLTRIRAQIALERHTLHRLQAKKEE